MNRRQLFAGVTTLILMPFAASAQTAEEQVIEQLSRQGYDRITLGRTLLGRTRIVATGSTGRREIILNPSTGAILRDYIDRSSVRRDDDDQSDDDDDRSGSNDGRDDDGNGHGGTDRDDDRDDESDDDDSDDDGDDNGGGNGNGDDDSDDDDD